MHPRVIRRAGTTCPHGLGAVEVDLLIGPTGHPEGVLRCSARRECPPACDGACRWATASVVGPARALFICPPGSGPPEELD